MANNLGRLFSSALQVSKSKSTLPICSSTSQLANRVLSSTSHDDHQDEKPIPKDKDKIEEREQEEDEDDGGGIDLNEETGEVGGPKGPEPTRFGDWERNGRCSDF
jgi:hypothetical protein